MRKPLLLGGTIATALGIVGAFIGWFYVYAFVGDIMIFVNGEGAGTPLTIHPAVIFILMAFPIVNALISFDIIPVCGGEVGWMVDLGVTIFFGLLFVIFGIGVASGGFSVKVATPPIWPRVLISCCCFLSAAGLASSLVGAYLE